MVETAQSHVTSFDVRFDRHCESHEDLTARGSVAHSESHYLTLLAPKKRQE